MLASPGASNEALYLAKALLEGFELTAAFRVERVDEERPLAGVPNLALRGERAPNVRGATLLGYREAFDEALEAVAEASLVLVVGDPLDGVAPAALRRAGTVVYVGAVLSEPARTARVVLPATNVAEEDGTFVNRDGRVQRYAQAKAGPGMARPAWWILGELLVELGTGESVASAEEAFARLAATEEAFRGLSYGRLGYRGVVADATAPGEVPR